MKWYTYRIKTEPKVRTNKSFDPNCSDITYSGNECKFEDALRYWSDPDNFKHVGYTATIELLSVEDKEDAWQWFVMQHFSLWAIQDGKLKLVGNDDHETVLTKADVADMIVGLSKMYEALP